MQPQTKKNGSNLSLLLIVNEHAVLELNRTGAHKSSQVAVASISDAGVVLNEASQPRKAFRGWQG